MLDARSGGRRRREQPRPCGGPPPPPAPACSCSLPHSLATSLSPPPESSVSHYTVPRQVSRPCGGLPPPSAVTSLVANTPASSVSYYIILSHVPLPYCGLLTATLSRHVAVAATGVISKLLYCTQTSLANMWGPAYRYPSASRHITVVATGVISKSCDQAGAHCHLQRPRHYRYHRRHQQVCYYTIPGQVSRSCNSPLFRKYLQV